MTYPHAIVIAAALVAGAILLSDRTGAADPENVSETPVGTILDAPPPGSIAVVDNIPGLPPGSVFVEGVPTPRVGDAVPTLTSVAIAVATGMRDASAAWVARGDGSVRFCIMAADGTPKNAPIVRCLDAKPGKSQ